MAGRRILFCAALLFLGAVPPVAAQEAPAPAPDAPALGPVAPGPSRANVIATLNQDRLFQETAYGKAVIARFETGRDEILTENRRIEAELAAEELALTTRRQSVTPEEFAPLAEAFDARVERIRTEQDGKSLALTRQLDQDKARFFELARPVLAEVLVASGAEVILAEQAAVMSLSSLDITDLAIARMDARYPGLPAEETVAPPATP